MSVTRTRHLRSPALLVALAAALAALILPAYGASPALASTITVTTTADEQTTNGACSLREAIEAANTDTAVDACAAGSATEDDVVGFALPGTAPWRVNLGSALPNVSTDMDLRGPGDDRLTVWATSEGYSIFTITGDATEAAISGMTMSNGDAPDDFVPGAIPCGGGGIYNGGTLNLTDSTVSDNMSATGCGSNSGFGSGGGVYNAGTMTVTGSTISGNDAYPAASGAGGGIFNGGILTVTNSTISGNTADGGGPDDDGGQGGGIYSDNLDDDSKLKIVNSTISGNSATAAAPDDSGDAGSGGEGGGIYNDGPPLTVTNSTISGNTAEGEGSAGAGGGGIFNFIGPATIEFSTITDNTAPRGNGSGVIGFTAASVFSSIISANRGTDVDFDSDFGGNGFTSIDHNLTGHGNATGAFDKTGDKVIGAGEPGLDPLGSYGGPTQTHRLRSGSPAVDGGPPPNSCPPPATDQRGVKRLQDGDGNGTANCDVGSFEVRKNATEPPPQRQCTVTGTRKGDTLRGTDGRDVICARGGADTVRGGGGSDLIRGGGGEDTIRAGRGADTVRGGGSADTIQGGRGDDRLYGNKGDDTIRGGDGRDVLRGGDGRDTTRQ